MNVFQQATSYIQTRRGPEYAGKAAHLSDLLRRIRGNGYKLMQRDGRWFLASNLDNRKKWEIIA